MNHKIAIVMGSDSDYETMKNIIPILKENHIDYEFRIISAHRTPQIAAEFAQNAKTDGYDLIIAGAGMSAHLAGVLASFTGVPIIGLPIKSESSGMYGMDALHSIIQMPPGIPVAAVGIDNAEGAAELAVKMTNCCSGIDLNNNKPIVKIVHNINEVSKESLEKVIKALDTYGINYKTITTDSDMLCEHDNTFVILNLTNTNIEKIILNNEYTKKIPIVEVPQKALSDNFNDTSNKIYYRTGESKSVAFVGVNSYQNAGHLIARILGIYNQEIYERVVNEHSKLAAAVIEKDTRIRNKEVDYE